MIWATIPEVGIWEEGISYPTFVDWRSQSERFSDMALVSRDEELTARVGEEYERIRAGRVSAGFFDVTGFRAALGRAFTAEEEGRGARVALISHGLWIRAYGGASDVLGRTVETREGGFEIVGVAPPRFRFPSLDTELWIPHTTASYWPRFPMMRSHDMYFVVGRLQRGVTIETAQADLDRVMDGLVLEFPAAYRTLGGRTKGAQVTPIRDQLLDPGARSALWILFAAAGLVLLIGCANISGLFLARGVSRRQELAVRRALGASRLRMLREQLGESAALLILAAAAGLVAAHVGMRALVAFAPVALPGMDAVSIDGAALGFGAAALILAGTMCSVGPVWVGNRTDPAEALGTARGELGSISARRARSALVVGQFAVALVLLVGAGLLIRSFLAIQQVDPGFRPEGALSLSVSPSGENKAETLREILRELDALPGVVAVGAIDDFDYEGFNPDATVSVEGRPPLSPGAPQPPLMFSQVQGDFFGAIGASLLRGRVFTEGDRAEGVRSLIVNRSFEEVFFGGESAIGRRATPGRARPDSEWYTIVGVVGDMRRQGLAQRPIAQLFLPRGNDPSFDVVVRTEVDPASLAMAIRAAVRSVDPGVPRFEITTIDRQLWEQGARRRFETGLLGLFAAVAVMLAAIGVYGLMSHDVARRRRELGVRAALGAQAHEVVGLVVKQGLGLAAVGLALGGVAAVALSGQLRRLLYEVEASDPWALMGAGGVLTAAAALACYLPARRAAKVEPMSALRQD